jgi:hypothetical protein
MPQANRSEMQERRGQANGKNKITISRPARQAAIDHHLKQLPRMARKEQIKEILKVWCGEYIIAIVNCWF